MKYEINEQAARAAKNANSMSDYVSGSATAEYNHYLKEFNEAVNDLKQKYGVTDEQQEAIDYYSDRYALKLATAMNRINAIDARVPSVLIAGFSNFPVRKKQKQNAAREKFWSECGELFEPTNNYYYRKIETMLSNKTIYSNDALALEKLQNKLSDLEQFHAEKIRRNAYYRKNGTFKGYEGVSDEDAQKFDNMIKNRTFSWEKLPYPSYDLQSDNAEMKRLRERIETIARMKERANTDNPNKYPTVDGVEVIENAELMRIQLKFEDIPNEEIRTILKSNGFRWAPSEKAWQRQLTPNGIRATKYLLEQLQKLNQGE